MSSQNGKEEVARILAEFHYRTEPGITEIFRLKSNGEAEELPDEPVKLLEVNEDTIPSGVMPLGFGPSPSDGITYASIIVELTPEEFEEVRSGQLPLPNDWTIGELIPRPTDAEQA